MLDFGKQFGPEFETVEERDKALASMDQLKVDKMTRESQLAQAEERVQRGAVRERDESDSSRCSHGWLTRCDAWAHGVCACDVLEADVEEERWRGEGGRDMRAVDRMSVDEGV